MTRVISYIDGFNLYFGLKNKGWKRYYWLDVSALSALSSALLKPGQQLQATHFFTARIRASGNNHEDKQRQDDYLDALESRPNFHIHQGHFLKKTQVCRSCGARWPDYEEKMTDVNIAVQLLADAFDGEFDTALIISADSDLASPVRFVLERFPHKRIIVAQPPGRNSVELAISATAAFTISQTKVRQNQLPERITNSAGVVLERPVTWK